MSWLLLSAWPISWSGLGLSGFERYELAKSLARQCAYISGPSIGTIDVDLGVAYPMVTEGCFAIT